MLERAHNLGPRCILIYVALFLLGVPPARVARAHPPYERVAKSIQMPNGNEVLLVKSYVDGIFFVDPVQVVMKDATSGEAFDETDYARDAVLSYGPGATGVFLFSSALSLVPSRAYTVREDGFVDVGSGNRLHGAVLHLTEHWMGYLVAIVIGAVASMVARGRTRGWLRWFAFGGLAGAVALWFYVVAALSRLLVPFALAAFFAGALLYGLWSVQGKKRKIVRFEPLGDGRWQG